MELTEIRSIVIERTGVINPHTVDDAINVVHRSYIQPSEKQYKTASYTVAGDSALKSDVAADIYKIDRVTKNKEPVPLLNPNDPTHRHGVRQEGDTLYFQDVDGELEFHYQVRLKRLGTGDNEVLEPEIDEEWHGLYWMGASAMLQPDFFPMFMEQLDRYRRERNKITRPRAMKVKARVWA